MRTQTKTDPIDFLVLHLASWESGASFYQLQSEVNKN